MGVVLADGCFDCLHVGHVIHLEAAARLGSKLIVALTTDECVNKGPNRPIFSWDERCRMLLALRCVADVMPTPSAEKAILEVKPAIYVKGKEYEGRCPEQELVEVMGGRVVFLDTKPVYSSSAILNGWMIDDRVRANRKRRV